MNYGFIAPNTDTIPLLLLLFSFSYHHRWNNNLYVYKELLLSINQDRELLQAIYNIK